MAQMIDGKMVPTPKMKEVIKKLEKGKDGYKPKDFEEFKNDMNTMKEAMDQKEKLVPLTWKENLLRNEVASIADKGINDYPREPETPMFDTRFPNQNQTRNCWQNFVDFHRCQKVKGEDYTPCHYFEKVYHSYCPEEWIETWKSQLDDGIFAGKI